MTYVHIRIYSRAFFTWLHLVKALFFYYQGKCSTVFHFSSLFDFAGLLVVLCLSVHSLLRIYQLVISALSLTGLLFFQANDALFYLHQQFSRPQLTY